MTQNTSLKFYTPFERFSSNKFAFQGLFRTRTLNFKFNCIQDTHPRYASSREIQFLTKHVSETGTTMHFSSFQFYQRQYFDFENTSHYGSNWGFLITVRCLNKTASHSLNNQNWTFLYTNWQRVWAIFHRQPVTFLLRRQFIK